MLIKLKDIYHRRRHIILWKLGHYISLLNRQNVVNEYLLKHKITKLQLACGPYRLKGWLNTDLFGGENLVSLNLTKDFPLPSNSFDYVFLEHTIEHFDIDQGLKLLKESHRVLKINGKIRIATPNIGFLMQLYRKNKTATQREYIAWHFKEFPNTAFNDDLSDAFLINKFFRDWGHKFIYDPKSLSLVLNKAGFKNIRKFKAGEGSNRHLSGIEKHWKSFSKRFNYLETFVLEAQK